MVWSAVFWNSTAAASVAGPPRVLASMTGVTLGSATPLEHTATLRGPRLPPACEPAAASVSLTHDVSRSYIKLILAPVHAQMPINSSC